MERKIMVASLALVTGVLAGGALAYSMNQDKLEARNYCSTVEQGIEENMSEGFINCYPPGVINVNLSKDVAEKSDIKCVCRKKVGDRIQTLTFAASN